MKIAFKEVYRDSIQSLFGTNVPAKDMVAAHANLTKTGVAEAQIGGGTFYDLFAKKGRNPHAENQAITNAFAGNDDGVETSALVRGAFLVGYEPQPYDVIKEYVRGLAESGVTRIENFHGLNDTRMQEPVARAAQELKEEEGLNIRVRGAICIEDNPNITIESCLESARQLLEQGHEGLYLKAASGAVKPEFVKELTRRLAEEFPDNKEIGVHVHATYGHAEPSYKAAAEGLREAEISLGREVDTTLQLDVAHPELAGSTGHPSMTDVEDVFANHEDPAIQSAAPTLNHDAIKADAAALREMRMQYRDTETVFDPDLLKLMEEARVPGGASSTLKGIKGLVPTLQGQMGTQDWTEIQKAVYIVQAEIMADLGHPVQVTPYAKNTTGQAGISLMHIMNSMTAEEKETLFDDKGKLKIDEFRQAVKERKDENAFKQLYGGLDGKSDMVAYLLGKHGKVPETVNPKLIDLAEEQSGEKRVVQLPSPHDMEPGLPKAAKGLENAIGEDFDAKVPKKEVPAWPPGTTKVVPISSAWQKKVNSWKDKILDSIHPHNVLMSALLGAGVAKNVLMAKNKPDETPSLPAYLQKPEDANNKKRSVAAVLDAAGGASMLQNFVNQAARLKNIDDGGFDELGMPDLVQKWRDEAIETLSRASRDVNAALQSYEEGVVPLNKYAKSDFIRAQVNGAIHEALDNRAAGLHDYVCEQLSAALPQEELCNGPVCYQKCEFVGAGVA